MKNNFSLSTALLLFFASSLAFAQADITVGKPYKVVDAPSKYYFYQNSEILTVKTNGRRVVLQKLDAEGLNFKKIMVYDDFPEDYVIEKIGEFNNRYYLFYSLWEKPFEQLFMREIDFELGAFIGKGERIIKVEGKISGTLKVSGFYNFDVVDKFDFFASHDSTKLLIQYRVKPDIKNDSKSFDIIGMNVFDKNMDFLWKKDITMPYTEKKMNNLDYSIDSEGNTYILTTVYEDNTTDTKKNQDGEANYHIELMRIKANTSDISLTPVKLNDKFINNIWIYESPNNYMICAGFYNNGKDLSDANGIFLFKLGKDGKAFDMKNYEIPLSILNQYVSEKSQRKNERKEEKDRAEFQELMLRDLVIEKDGSLLLIGEQYYMESHTYYSNGQYRTYYTYHYNDMLVSKIDASGKLAWMKKLPKRQFGRSGPGGMSYRYMRTGNKHCFLYLDNVNNLNLPLNKVPERHMDGAGGFLTAYEVNDNNGEVNKISILNTKDVKGMPIYQFLTSRILPLSSNKFVFEVYKKKKEDILIEVTL